MKDEHLQYFRDLLNQQLEELLKKGDDTVSGLKEGQDENLSDPSDRATLEIDQFMLLRIRDRERKLIEKILKAFKRIDEGEFGVCEQCGEDISLSRLKARPVTTLCISCKTRQERSEKTTGS